MSVSDELDALAPWLVHGRIVLGVHAVADDSGNSPEHREIRMSAEDVFALTRKCVSALRFHDEEQIAVRLENAFFLGSSSLEILGAIRAAILDNHDWVVRLLGATTTADIVAFVDMSYGRIPPK